MPEKLLEAKNKIPEIPSSPLKRIETGSISQAGSGWRSVHVTFSKPFDTIPFVFIQKTFTGATVEDWSTRNVSTTGFDAYYYFSSTFTIGGQWIAMELNEEN